MNATVDTVNIPNLTDPETFVSGVPFDAFASIREMPGLHWQPAAIGTDHGGFWVVTRFADILEAEANPAVFSSQRGPSWPLSNNPVSTDLSVNPLYNHLVAMDPPRHSRVRRVAAAAFGPRVVKNFEPWVREIVTGVLDHVDGLDDFDYVTEIAQAIPSAVIAQIQGVPRSERQFVVDKTILTFAALASGDFEATMKNVREVEDYYRTTLVPQKRRDPQDDMTTVILHACERGDVTEGEMYDFLNLLQTAGYETTHTAIGQSMRMILEDPEVAERTFRGIEELGADKVVDEFLRLISPPMYMTRSATQDTELGGQMIRKDDVLNLYFIAANRDPAVFDEPDKFDPWRKETATLAFGSGPHRCIGSALAKLEMRILFEEMTKRGFKFEQNGKPERGWSVFINQLNSLPVARVRDAR
ncbi:cytochrome P450 [Nocardia fluminea]|uniref:cytochrome P450 n=1 Tax=Nocardia fluminea TaxID=134984 RepID=UPI003425A8D9